MNSKVAEVILLYEESLVTEQDLAKINKKLLDSLGVLGETLERGSHAVLHNDTVHIIRVDGGYKENVSIVASYPFVGNVLGLPQESTEEEGPLKMSVNFTCPSCQSQIVRDCRSRAGQKKIIYVMACDCGQVYSASVPHVEDLNIHVSEYRQERDNEDSE